MSSVFLDESAVSVSASVHGKVCSKAFGCDVSASQQQQQQQQELAAFKAVLKKEAADAAAVAKQEVSKAQMEVCVWDEGLARMGSAVGYCCHFNRGGWILHVVSEMYCRVSCYLCYMHCIA